MVNVRREVANVRREKGSVKCKKRKIRPEVLEKVFTIYILNY